MIEYTTQKFFFEFNAVQSSMSEEGYIIYPHFSGHGVRMYRSAEMCKANEHLYDIDVTFSDKGQNVKNVQI